MRSARVFLARDANAPPYGCAPLAHSDSTLGPLRLRRPDLLENRRSIGGAAGQCLAVIEAMKMEHTLRAPHAGVVRHIAVAAGAQVVEGAEIMMIEAVRTRKVDQCLCIS